MSTKVNRIMLVDDNRDDIFFHTRTIRKANPQIEVIPVLDASQALDYLTLAQRGEKPAVDLIFLDINMPGMSGWDFLEAHMSLFGKAAHAIVMLTTSSREEERVRALTFPSVVDFKTKPLTTEMLHEILSRS